VSEGAAEVAPAARGGTGTSPPSKPRSQPRQPQLDQFFRYLTVLFVDDC
jgi:hypothetical protein